MSLSIAELFVNLGIKGSEKTVGALNQTKKGLGEVSSMSLEAKAGILAAVYALEQLMSISGKTGTGLSNFAASTGLSGQTLQEWQYAARQAGESADDLMSSVKGVQDSMTEMILHGNAPSGLAMVAQVTGGFDMKQARDTFYVMEKLNQAAKLLPADVGAKVIKSFHVSDANYAAMRRGVFNPEMFAKAPKYSDSEIKQLDKVNIAWANLGQKIEMAMGHFTSQHGAQLVGDLSRLTSEVLKLVSAFTTLAEKLKLFQVIGKAFEGWSLIFQNANKGVDSINKFADSHDKAESFKTSMMGFFGGIADAWEGMQIEQQQQIEAHQKELQKNSWLIPKVQSSPPSTTSNVTNINQKITHHGDAKDTKAVKDTHGAAIGHAYRQRPGQKQGS